MKQRFLGSRLGASWFLVPGLLMALGTATVGADDKEAIPGSGFHLGGYAIYEADVAVQTFRHLNDGTTDNSQITADAGPWWQLDDVGGRTCINFNYDKDGFTVNTSFRWDESTVASAVASGMSSSSPNASTLLSINPINTANVAFKMFDGQIKLRSGLYQEEGLGFDLNGYATGIVGRYLASSHGGGTDSVYLTSVEYNPEEVPGLSMLFGEPIEPNNAVSAASGTYSTLAASELYKRFRFTAKYDLPDVGLIHAYWYNALYANQTSDTAAGFKMTNQGEGLNEYLLGIENISFAGASWKFGYVLDNNRGSANDAVQHNLTISSKITPIEGLTISADNIFSAFNKDWATTNCAYGMTATGTDGGAQAVYADPAEWADNKIGLLDHLQVNTAYVYKSWEFGMIAGAIYEPFSNGHFWAWGQPTAEFVAANGYNSGEGDVGQGNEWTFVFNPYVKYNIGHGNIQITFVETYDRKSVGGKTTWAYNWQVPIDFFVWF